MVQYIHNQKAGEYMTLRDGLLQSGQHIVRQFAEHIRSDLLDQTAVSYTDDLYSKLRESIEDYVRTIHYAARIEYVIEINGFADTFFGGRFQNVCRINNVLNSTEIDILLLKALQAGSDASLYPNSQAERAEQFGMSVNAIQSRIHALEDGKDILGHHVQIRIAGRGQTAYDNTIHPVFLTLNLQEVFFLTVRLKQAFDGTEYAKIADNLANDVYSQLSDYAKGVLKPHTADLVFETNDIHEPVPYRQEQKDVIYYLKSGERCRLITLSGTEYTGKVVCQDNDLILLTSCGERISIPEDRSVYSLMPSDQA